LEVVRSRAFTAAIAEQLKSNNGVTFPPLPPTRSTLCAARFQKRQWPVATKQGQFIKQLSMDPAQGGSFGLAVRTTQQTAFFAAVADNTATLSVWPIPLSMND